MRHYFYIRDHDPAIWRPLPDAELDGVRWTPYVKRVYRFTGISNGVRCDFPVTLVKRHPSISGCYQPEAIMAMNCWYTPDWVNLRDLQEEAIP